MWEPFAARWGEVVAAKTLHRDLFQQREYLATDRDSVELVWGFGRLCWRHDGVVIDHPLVTIPVEVEQDKVTQRIRVCPARQKSRRAVWRACRWPTVPGS